MFEVAEVTQKFKIEHRNRFSYLTDDDATRELKKRMDSTRSERVREQLRTIVFLRKLLRWCESDVLYRGRECAVIDGSGVYYWLEIKTGVKQDCCMSGFSFPASVVLDWTTRKTTK